MTYAKKILGAVVAVGMLLITAPSPLWAESAAPSGDAADFLTDPVTLLPITCPDPNISTNPACFDPNASGTKISATLAVVYDKTTPGNCDPSNAQIPFINNMYVSLTFLQGNNLRVPFTTDYLEGVRPHGGGFCFLTNDAEQVKVIIDLIRIKVIPFFFSCGAGPCPSFKVKSITHHEITVGPTSSDTSGGFSADITIAVR